jgi:hypothetical protein
MSGDEQKLEGVTEVHDSDVLCGRGGAALRHAGNQTYRKLVSLNKGLYITCLKTEKLKISRSIVAAIREKKGRFLEKDGKSGTWYDIGDKKAVEKTSQALREGQPKLRQQIVEMGGGTAGATSLIEAQFGPQAAAAVAGAGLYTQQPNRHSVQGGGGSILAHASPQQQQQSHLSMGNEGMRQQMMMNQQVYSAMQQQQQHLQQQQQQQHASQQMNGLPFDDIQNDLMSRLSLHDDSSRMPSQQQVEAMQMRHMMSMPDNGGGYGPGQLIMNQQQQQQQMRMMDAAAGGGVMPDSFHMAMRGMASPNASVQNSLHSTQHTLDFSSMHSLDFMSGMSGHSIGMPSNHSMGPPSAHQMSSMSGVGGGITMPRQQQIDERYPQNIGLDSQTMTQSFQRQAHDSLLPPQPPPQPSQPRQHVGQDLSSSSVQPRFHGWQSTQMNPGQGSLTHSGQTVRTAYGGVAVARGVNDGLGSPAGVPAFSEDANDRLPVEFSSGAEQGPGMRGQTRRYEGGEEAQRNEPPRLAMSSAEGNFKGAVTGSAPATNSSSGTGQHNMTAMASTILSPETRQKMVDRRSMLAKMKFRKPPSVRDTKMGGMSTHSTGDGMPDIFMVESARSLHSTLSNMTDGTSLRQAGTGTPTNGGGGGARDPWVETARVVDHSSRDYMEVMGSKLSLMSGLSKISDHSLNDVSIFSGLSNKIGNVSTRSIAAMSEISVIEVPAEKDEEEGVDEEEVKTPSATANRESETAKEEK